MYQCLWPSAALYLDEIVPCFILTVNRGWSESNALMFTPSSLLPAYYFPIFLKKILSFKTQSTNESPRSSKNWHLGCWKKSMQFSNKQAELNELRQIIPFYYPKDSAIGFKIHLLFSLFILLLSHLVFSGTQACTMHRGIVATLMQILSFCVQAKSTSDACLTQLKWTFNVR